MEFQKYDQGRRFIRRQYENIRESFNITDALQRNVGSKHIQIGFKNKNKVV